MSLRPITMTAIKKTKTKSKSSKSPAPAMSVTPARVAKPASAAKPAPAAKLAAKPVATKPAPAKKKPAPAISAATLAQFAKPSAVKPVVSKPVVTRISADIDIGFGNALYLRGEGAGLSWDKGLLMTCITGDQWQIVLGESARPIVFKFLVNDLSWSAGEDYLVAPGSSLTIAPTF